MNEDEFEIDWDAYQSAAEEAKWADEAAWGYSQDDFEAAYEDRDDAPPVLHACGHHVKYVSPFGQPERPGNAEDPCSFCRAGLPCDDPFAD